MVADLASPSGELPEAVNQGWLRQQRAGQPGSLGDMRRRQVRVGGGLIAPLLDRHELAWVVLIVEQVVAKAAAFVTTRAAQVAQDRCQHCLTACPGCQPGHDPDRHYLVLLGPASILAPGRGVQWPCRSLIISP